MANIAYRTWYGGISENEYLGSEKGQCLFNKGIETQRNLRKFYLGPVPGEYMSISTTNGYFTAFLKETAYGSNKVMGLTSKSIIYDVALGIGKHQNTSDQTGQNLALFRITEGTATNYVMINNSAITRFNYDGTTVGNVTENYKTLSTPGVDNTTYRPINYNFGGELLIGRGNKVDQLEINGDLNNVLTLGYYDTIVSIHKYLDQIIIFTTNRQYYWDGVSSTVTGIIDWTNHEIKNTVIINNLIYVISKKDGFYYLYIANGGQPQKMFKISDSDNRAKFTSNYTNAIESKDDILFFPSDGQGVIYTYGNFYGNQPKALNSLINYGVSTDITAIYLDNNQLYWGYTQSTNTKLGYINLNNTTYNSGGYLETTPLELDDDAKCIRIVSNYRLTSANESIKIYYKTNDAANYTLLETIDGANSIYLNKRKHTTILTGEFNKIQFKIELITTNGSFTPYFQSLIFIYETIKADYEKAND